MIFDSDVVDEILNVLVEQCLGPLGAEVVVYNPFPLEVDFLAVQKYFSHIVLCNSLRYPDGTFLYSYKRLILGSARGSWAPATAVH